MVWLESPKCQLSKTFCRLKIGWISRKLWVKTCVCSFDTFDMHRHYSPQLFWATFDTSDIDSIWGYGWKALSLSFPKLFADWKSVEYQESYEQRCVRPFWASFNTFDIHSITALIGYIELLLTPSTYPFISVSLYLFCLYVQLYTY